MNGDWTWGDLVQTVMGVLQWTIAILAVAGTLALFGWILTMVVRKDKAQ
jgi:hypothetical protein